MFSLLMAIFAFIRPLENLICSRQRSWKPPPITSPAYTPVHLMWWRRPPVRGGRENGEPTLSPAARRIYLSDLVSFTARGPERRRGHNKREQPAPWLLARAGPAATWHQTGLGGTGCSSHLTLDMAAPCGVWMGC